MADSIDWYDGNAATFVEATGKVEMEPVRARFLAEVRCPPADILDAGCGSGRDARAFLDLGYRVAAIDGSAAMAKHASQLLGHPVRHLRFEAVEDVDRYDGIWCCASLLHVRPADLLDVFRRLARSLRPAGVWYLSMKAGRGERFEGGRRFTDIDEEGLQRLLEALPGLGLIEAWRTAGRQPGREHITWLNALIRKESALTSPVRA
ncbi:class I SAM-dependent methyltransferase (plasmid) [Acidiphilium multivorum]|uniref:class I SAM-dependent methyltransferase n=1 Tax=Acidiphilium TaxID=522 RepID=UPI00157A6AC8|nr:MULTISPECIES: class I SAM-dependent methyltransferase [Acidiphilium]UNC16237.1 class I SAM-dependent methyltransferase [Acidiphilium multivorum]